MSKLMVQHTIPILVSGVAARLSRTLACAHFARYVWDALRFVNM